MKLFLDSADLKEIRRAVDAGLIDGITTNPSLLSKVAGPENARGVLAEICRTVNGPISAEVIATDFEPMVAEGRELAKIADNIVVKVPLTEAGLHACRRFRSEGIGVNVTLCFSGTQALLAAKAGATFVSPFVGRLDDVQDGSSDRADRPDLPELRLPDAGAGGIRAAPGARAAGRAAGSTRCYHSGQDAAPADEAPAHGPRPRGLPRGLEQGR
jgi:transaldolase